MHLRWLLLALRDAHERVGLNHWLVDDNLRAVCACDADVLRLSSR